MTKYFYNTETGQADGTTVTTALLPANGVSPSLTTAGTFTVQFKTAAAAQGTLGIRGTGTVSGASVQIRFGASPTFSTGDANWDGSWAVSAYPSGTTRFFGFYAGGFTTLIGGLAMDSTGHILVQNQPGSTVYTTVAVVPIGSVFRWNIRLRQGTTTSNGIIDFNYYATYAATTPTETMPQITNANLSTFATNPITNAIKGKVTTTGTWSQWDMDADQFTDNPSVDGVFTGPNGISAAGTVAAVSTVAGSVTELSPVAGSVAATSAVAGAVSARLAVSGTVGGGTSLAGAAGGLLPVSGSIAATTVVAGAVTELSPVVGVTAAMSGAAGTVGVTRPVSGSVAATSAVSAAAVVVPGAGFAVAGTVSAVSAIAGTVSLRAGVLGVVPATSSMVGAARSIASVAGTASADTAVVGAITAQLGVSGMVLAFTNASGDVVILGSLRDITLTAEPLTERWTAVELEDHYTTAPLATRWAVEPLHDRWAATPAPSRWTTTPEDLS